MADSSEKTQRDQEYEIQYFGCTSDDIFEGIKNLTKEELNYTIDVMVNFMKEKLSPEDATRVANDLKTIYQNVSVEPLQKIQSKIKELFSIPSFVLLPEDKRQQKQYTEGDMKNIDEEIEVLFQKIQKATYVETSLKNAYEEAKDVLHEIDCELKERNIQLNK